MLAELSITPLCEIEDSADWMAQVINKIDESGLKYQVTAMGTLIETDDWDSLMETIHDCQKIMLTHCPRVQTDLRIDEHLGQRSLLTSRVEQMESLTNKEFH